MTIRTSAEAIKVASDQTHNIPGTCQANVHTWFNAPSVGDVDRDGDADAVDGWESEPKAYRHFGDRTPPPGVPLSFHGGSHGYGHRCISLFLPGRIRSTDMGGNRYEAGITGTISATTTSEAIAIIERSMGISYTGWSETISGQLIPDFKQKPGPPPAPQTRGVRIDRSLWRLRKAYAKTADKKSVRAKAIAAAIQSLLKVPTHDKKI